LPAELRADSAEPLRCYLDTAFRISSEDFFLKVIVPAVRASDAMIVVATPDACKKLRGGGDNWVERELDTYLEQHPSGEGLIVALAAGRLTDPLPARLHERFPNVDIADIRGRTLWGRLRGPAAVEDEILTIVGRLRGLSPNQMPILRREAARQLAAQRQRQARIGAVLALLLGTLAIWAVYNLLQARRELANNLVAQGERLVEGRPDEARLLFARAVSAAAPLVSWLPVTGADDQLARAWLGRFVSSAGSSTTELNSDGDSIVVVAPEPNRLLVMRSQSAAIMSLLVSGLDGRAATEVGNLQLPQVPLWPPLRSRMGTWFLGAGKLLNLARGTASDRANQSTTAWYVSAAFSRDEKLLLLGTPALHLLNLEADTEAARLLRPSGSQVLAVSATHDNGFVTLEKEAANGRLAFWSHQGAADTNPSVELGLELEYPLLASAVLAPCVAAHVRHGFVELLQCGTEARSARVQGSPLTHLELSPSGNRMLTLGPDHICRVWDISDPEASARLVQEIKDVGSARLSPSGDLLVATARDYVRVWSAASGFPVTEPLALPVAVEDARFDEKEAWLVVAGGSFVRRWSLADVRRATVSIDSKTRPLGVSSVSLLTFDDEAKRPWLVPISAGGKPARPLAEDDCSLVTWSDGCAVLQCSESWQRVTLDGAAQVARAPVEEGAEVVGANSNCSRAIVRTGDRLQAWDLERGVALGPAIQCSTQVDAGEVAFASGSSELAVIDRDVLRLFDLATGKQAFAFEAYPTPTTAYDFLRVGVDGAQAAIEVDPRPPFIRGETVLQVVDLARRSALGPPISLGRYATLRDARFSDDGRRVAVVVDRTLRAWQVETGRPIAGIETGPYDGLLRGPQDQVGVLSTDRKLVWLTTLALAQGSPATLELAAEVYASKRQDPDGSRITLLRAADWTARHQRWMASGSAGR
jgi:WD40 repeat protein